MVSVPLSVLGVFIVYKMGASSFPVYQRSVTVIAVYQGGIKLWIYLL